MAFPIKEEDSSVSHLIHFAVKVLMKFIKVDERNLIEIVKNKLIYFLYPLIGGEPIYRFAAVKDLITKEVRRIIKDKINIFSIFE